MRRDWNKLRAMLFAVERNEMFDPVSAQKHGFNTLEDAGEYMLLASEAGFVRDLVDQRSIYADHWWFNNHGLTHAGADFLDAIRDDDTWRYVNDCITEHDGLPSQLVLELALAHKRADLQLPKAQP